jgi:hypothetical protein
MEDEGSFCDCFCCCLGVLDSIARFIVKGDDVHTVRVAGEMMHRLAREIARVDRFMVSLLCNMPFSYYR